MDTSRARRNVDASRTNGNGDTSETDFNVDTLSTPSTCLHATSVPGG